MTINPIYYVFFIYIFSIKYSISDAHFSIEDSDMVEMVLLGEPDCMESIRTPNISIWRHE